MSPAFDVEAEVERLTAVRQARSRIAARPDSSDAHADLAWALMRAYLRGLRGKHAFEAQAAADAAVRLAPESPRAHHTAGRVAAARGRPAEAVAAFRRGLALDPMSAALHNDLGVTLQRMGLRREAVHAYGTASQIDPDDSLAYDNARRVDAVKIGIGLILAVSIFRATIGDEVVSALENTAVLVAAVVAMAAIALARWLQLEARSRAVGLPRADPEVMRRLRRDERQENLGFGWFGWVGVAGFAIFGLVVVAALILG